jgi:Transposase
MQDVEDEPLFAERVAGIDIAKAGIEVAVRVPSGTTAGRRQQETRSFRTTRKELLALADWLQSWGVTKVGMESTGVIRGRDQASATDGDGPLCPFRHPWQTGYLGTVCDADSRPQSRCRRGPSSLPLLSFPSRTRPRRHDLGNVQFPTFAPRITPDYWKPVYFLLEQQDLECVLYHAAQVKALPGRPKTDKLDSVWLAKITERGSLPSIFVPPEDIRRLRTHTRYRRTVTQARTAEMQRVEKLLEDAHFSEQST